MILSAACLRTARLVGRGYAGAATSTSANATTLVDASQKSTTDDYFNGGVIFFLSGANAGLVRTITDYVNSTRTFTFAAVTGNPAAGDRYEVYRDNYNRFELVQAVSQALDEIGTVTQHNDTVVVDVDVDEYDLPAGVYNVVRVEEAANAAAPYGWEARYSWAENANHLIFDPGKAPANDGNLLRIWYNAPHALVVNDSDVISDYINPERLAWAAAYYAAYNRMRVVEGDDPKLKEYIQLAGTRMAEMAVRYPVRLMTPTPRLRGW